MHSPSLRQRHIGVVAQSASPVVTQAPSRAVHFPSSWQTLEDRQAVVSRDAALFRAPAASVRATFLRATWLIVPISAPAAREHQQDEKPPSPIVHHHAASSTDRTATSWWRSSSAYQRHIRLVFLRKSSVPCSWPSQFGRRSATHLGRSVRYLSTLLSISPKTRFRPIQVRAFVRRRPSAGGAWIGVGSSFVLRWR